MTSAAPRRLASWLAPRITRRARTTQTPGLPVIDTAVQGCIQHVVPVPRGACPISGNPRGGTFTLSYSSDRAALEVASLPGWVAATIRGQRSLEAAAYAVVAGVADALGVTTTGTMDVVLRPHQGYTITITVER